MRLLSGFSILAVLGTVVILLTGQMTAAQNLLGPEGQENAINSVRGTIGEVQSAAMHQRMDALYKSARLAQIAGETGSLEQLRDELADSEPGALIGRRFEDGGTLVRLFDPGPQAVVEFCAEDLGERIITCGRGSLAPASQIRYGNGTTLAQARQNAVDGTLSSVGKSDDEVSEQKQSAVEKAREAAQAAGG